MLPKKLLWIKTQNLSFTCGKRTLNTFLFKQEIQKKKKRDIAGQERFIAVTRPFYKDATAAIVVFDITDRKSFEKVADWKREINNKQRDNFQNKNFPVILLANKV